MIVIGTIARMKFLTVKNRLVLANGKFGGNDGIKNANIFSSSIPEMTRIVPSEWINERVPDLWRHAITIPLHKKLSATEPSRMSLLRVMYKFLERIVLHRLTKRREETIRDEQAGFSADSVNS
ncbi:hypothetical protein RB195_003342 [Necator americanus]|uniref:Uncharacterized protein n=1 Tax=Necator americanus TaxID=51031 RepID=A0ABR1DPH9_NECAM